MSMDNAAFKPHGTSSARDLPMTRASFHIAGTFIRCNCFIIIQVWYCDTKNSRIGCCSLAYTRTKVARCILCPRYAKEGVQHIFIIFEYVDKESIWYSLLVILQCGYGRLRNLKGIHGSYKALISSKKAMHGFMGTCYLQSTKQTLSINESFNNTVAAQGPGHEDRVVSGKEYS